MNNKHIKYLAEVTDAAGDQKNLDSNTSFRKFTTFGEYFGCILSSFELRGYFESLSGNAPSRNGRPYPLLTYPFLDFIESHNLKNFNLIEFGSGNSTLFFENLFFHVTSFETDINWYSALKGKLNNTAYNYTSKLDIEEGKFILEEKYVKNSFVLIDCACNRLKVSINLLNKYKPPFIILDNSEWYRNTSDFIVKENYIEIPFWGYKNSEHWESCTSLFINKNNVIDLQRNENSPPPLSRKMVNGWDHL